MEFSKDTLLLYAKNRTQPFGNIEPAPGRGGSLEEWNYPVAAAGRNTCLMRNCWLWPRQWPTWLKHTACPLSLTIVPISLWRLKPTAFTWDNKMAVSKKPEKFWAPKDHRRHGSQRGTGFASPGGWRQLSRRRAMFPSSTKDTASITPRETVIAIAAATSPCPLWSSAGSRGRQYQNIEGLGASGAAVVSAIFGGEDVAQRTKTMRTLCEEVFLLCLKCLPSPVPILRAARESKQISKPCDCPRRFRDVGGNGSLPKIPLGVTSILESTPQFFWQISWTRYLPILYPTRVKIGMVANENLICVIAEKLKKYCAKNIVVDPVMIATSGSSLMDSSASLALKEELIPLWRTSSPPTVPEAEAFERLFHGSAADMEIAAKTILQWYQGYILVKGGHSEADANDLLFFDGACQWFYGPRVDNPNTHGTGCTLFRPLLAVWHQGMAMTGSWGLPKLISLPPLPPNWRGRQRRTLKSYGAFASLASLTFCGNGSKTKVYHEESSNGKRPVNSGLFS